MCQKIFFTVGFSNCSFHHKNYHMHFPLIVAAGPAKSLQSCPTLCDLIDGNSPAPPPPTWDSPGRNTGVGCCFLLQCMKVKSEREVAQSCPTLSDPMDCSPPGSSVHGIFQARVLEWGAIAFSIPLPIFLLPFRIKFYKFTGVCMGAQACLTL